MNEQVVQAFGEKHAGVAVSIRQKACPWVAWSYVQRGDHMTKPPIDPKTGKFASVADPNTWGTYEEAATYAQAHGCDGVGVVLTGAEGVIAIDLDDCLDADGKAEPWVQELLDQRETYAERSPSGRGLRMFAAGTLDKALVSASVGVEVYSKGRFVTFTGDAIPGAPDAIREAPRTLKALQRRVEARRAEQQELAKAAVRAPVAVSSSGESFFAKVNKLSLDHPDVWIPELLPFAKASGNGYRVSSYDLGRDLQEDLSITPDGIKDFGVADMGDDRLGCRTAIDLVIEHGEGAGLSMVQLGDGDDDAKRKRVNAVNAATAADWLCERLGVSPWGIGKPPISSADWLGYLNEHHAVIRESGKTFVGRYRIDYQYKPPRNGLILESIHAVREFYANKFVTNKVLKLVSVDGKRQEIEVDESINVVKLWLTHPYRRQYDGITFLPGGPKEVHGCLNLWTGFAVHPKTGDWSKMQWHIDHVLASGDPEVATYIRNWCAFAVQHPDKPAEAALVMRGRKGTGKGTLGNALCQIFGQHGTHINNANHLVGTFNAHLRDTCVLFADEAYWPGNKGAEGTIKALITEPTLSIEAKGRDRVEARNMLHIVMASNDDWVVPAGADERRYAMIDVSDCMMQDQGYFGALHKELREGGLSAMLYDLLRIDLTDWHPRMIPRTKALADQQEVGLSVEDQWWKTKLNDGYVVGSHATRPDWVLSAVLLTDIRTFSPKLGTYNEQQIASMLKRYGSSKGPKQASRNAWNLPPLGQARAEWLKRYSGTVWDDPAQTEWGHEDADVESLHKVPESDVGGGGG